MTYVVKDDDALWFFLPLLFWGVGLIIHYLNSVALFDEWWKLNERNINSRKGGYGPEGTAPTLNTPISGPVVVAVPTGGMNG